MEQLISEITSSLESENYLSALALTLILPDICGKIAYPKLKTSNQVGERYARWYNEYIYPYELSQNKDQSYNEWIPDGDTIYKLRCNLFHDGSVLIDDYIKRKKDGYVDYKFILTNNFSSINLIWEEGDNNPRVLIRLAVEDFCRKICAVAVNFYNEHSKGLDIYNDILIFDFSYNRN